MATEPAEYMEDVQKQVQFWTARKQYLKGLNEYSRSHLPPDKLATVGNIDLYLLEEMLIRSGHTDKSFVKDLLDGFPVTGSIPSGGCGQEIPGGQRVHGRPGLGGPEPIELLKESCRHTHSATIQAALERNGGPSTDKELVDETWAKFEQDVQRGFIGTPQELDTVDLEQILLVESFGIWEQHAGSLRKVRIINNFRSIKVNSFAWLPAKMKYDATRMSPHFEL